MKTWKSWVMPFITSMLFTGVCCAPLCAQELSSDPLPVRYYAKTCRAAIRTLQNIDASAEQRQQIAQSFIRYRTDLEELNAQLAEPLKNLFAATHNPQLNFDETGIRNAYQDVASILEERAVQKGQLMQELHSLLSPLQYLRVTAADILVTSCLNAPERVFAAALLRWAEENGG